MEPTHEEEVVAPSPVPAAPAKFNFNKILLGVVVGVLAVALVSIGIQRQRTRVVIEQIQNLPIPESSETLPTGDTEIGDAPIRTATPFEVPYEEQTVAVSPEIAKDFSLSEVKNIGDMEKAYGFTFSPEELKQLETSKFVVKNILDTNLTPVNVDDTNREFVSLYQRVAGPTDYKARTQANAVYISSDVLMNLFSILSVDLLKETENTYLNKDVLTLTKIMYTKANEHITRATTDTERTQWTKVRDYFAVPYALLSVAKVPITADSYLNGGGPESVESAVEAFRKEDEVADSYENAAAFVKTLGLGNESETVVLADIKRVYDAPDKDHPLLFDTEYKAIPGPIEFDIPFSLFKPRGSYTSSSLRRQYFRAVQWYQQIPFFVSSPELTQYALKIAEIAHDDPTILKGYESMTSLLGALVGTSDDLAIEDYVAAVDTLGADIADQSKVKAFLDTQKPAAKIKGMPATYAGVGVVDRAQVIDATRGMRFFSQKFIPDSYWTGMLTQGDEKPDVQGMKLPLDTSSLMVMDILGSTYAQSSLPMLPFYQRYKGGIDARIAELKVEAANWGESYWKSNQVTSILWTIRGLFSWFQDNRASLPRFMQSPLWDIKTLATGSGFWTEMRHTNILYAKQSFAEKGGGGDDACDAREVPPPPQGYVEPQLKAYDRLYYTARLLHGEYTSRGYKLSNLSNLGEFIELMNIIREYTKLELENTAFRENVISQKSEYIPNCVEHVISPESAISRESNWPSSARSRSEELRIEMVRRMRGILPYPVEGPILPIKDKRAALIADIHTSDNGKLEEAIGVPRVIFVAVKDANGPRLTVGFTYSHYEFLSGPRLTDEEWQKNFYTDEGGDSQITYTPKSSWPTIPLWYQQLFGTQ